MRSRVHDAGENRVARKRAARRRLVGHTAADVFAERGYEGAGFDEIGARLDLRGPSLYHCYSSEEELFLRTVENGRAEVLDRLRSLAREVAEQHDIPPRRASIAVLPALGALGDLHSWYRPDGPLSLDQIATEVADVLLQPFLTAG